MAKGDSLRWRLSIEATARAGAYTGIQGMYESYSLRQVKEIINEMRKENVTLPVDKVIPITPWLLLYAFTEFEKRFGSADYTLIKIEVEDIRGM